MMKLKSMIFLMSLFLIILAGCSRNDGNSGKVTINTLDEKEIEVTYSKGKIEKFKNMQFSGITNKIVLISFFSTSCGPCRDEIPSLINLQNKYKNDFEVIGVLVEDKELLSIKEFAESYEINYKVTDAGEEYALTNLVGGVRGIPALFMYDKKGAYATHYIGAVPQAMIENDIKKILGR